MRPSRILNKARNGEPALISALHFREPQVYELYSLMGFDGIWMDLEHHPTSLEKADELMRAARVGVSDIVARPARWEYMRMGRMLEAGAQGILYPRCESAEEAAEVVKWAKFYPLGERGQDAGNPDNPYCCAPTDEYVRFANEQTFIAIQLESPRAMEQAEAIAAVEGVDFLFFGPGDFSVLIGKPGQVQTPEADKALKRIAKAADNAGKWWATVSFGPEHARELLDRGCMLTTRGADLLWMRDGMAKVQEEYGALGFTFDPRVGPGASYLQGDAAR
ncbi:MAG: HpcH/HpaI aldolase family protein [Phycisphaeraceae bacterium]